MLANLGEQQQAAHYYQLALANLDRESDREKYRTRGGYYLMMRDYKKAAEQFGQLVKQYPVDSAGLANLALADFYAGNMTAALAEGRKAVQIYPHNILQRNNVGLYAMYAGDFDAAIQESQTIIKMNRSFEKAYLCLGISELQKGSPDSATAAYEKLSKLSDWGASQGALALADLALYQGRFKDAAKLLQAGLSADKTQKKASPAATKLIALAQAQMHRKQRALAMKSAAEAIATSQDESVLYSAAALDIQAGDVTSAATIAKKLDDQFEPEPRALGKLIQGEIEIQSGKLHDAVSSLEESQKLADTWLGRFDLGRAYLAAKLYPDAENEFDVCLKRRGEASAVFLDDEPTVRYVPEIYYYLGVAKAGLGDANAASDLKTFLAIKQGSEADPMVADATRRLKAQ
jgi:tetratricopeptide (TPR) repeat protein